MTNLTLSAYTGPSWLNWPISFNGPVLQHHRLKNTIHLTLKMTSAQVDESSVTNNSSFQNYSHPDDHTLRTPHVVLFCKPNHKISQAFLACIALGGWELFPDIMGWVYCQKKAFQHFISLSNFWDNIALTQPYRNQLYCQLTKKYINNAPHHIQRHVTGKRFTRALDKRKA